MVFKISYDWEMKYDIQSLLESKISSYVLSPYFIGSSDETVHYWRTGIRFDPSQPDIFGVMLYLMDQIFQKAISVKFDFKIVNQNNKSICGTSTEYKFDMA